AILPVLPVFAGVESAGGRKLVRGVIHPHAGLTGGRRGGPSANARRNVWAGKTAVKPERGTGHSGPEKERITLECNTPLTFSCRGPLSTPAKTGRTGRIRP